MNGSPSIYAALVRRLSSRGAVVVGAMWGFAEATLFFIVPDVWLGLVALYVPRRAPAVLLAILVGACMGAVALYAASIATGPDVGDLIVMLPGIGAGDIERVQAELGEQGVAAFLAAILAGVPVKVYIHASAILGIGLPEVLAATAANRLERMIAFGLVMGVIGVLGRGVIARWPRAVAGLYVAGWTIFYAAFLVARDA